MIQRGGRARFALEATQLVAIRGDGRRQNLDRHGAIQPRVARAVHFAHAARAEQRNDFVRTKMRAWKERHVGANYTST